VSYSKWISKCDHIKWLALYLEFENFFFKKLPSYIAKNIKINDKTFKILRNIEQHWDTLRHWKLWVVFQYIESQTLNSIQCQCGKLKHWKGTHCQCQFFQYFNVLLNVRCRFADPYYKCLCNKNVTMGVDSVIFFQKMLDIIYGRSLKMKMIQLFLKIDW
jgi:hypothetical protein